MPENDRHDDFWRRVREADDAREYDEDGKTVVREGEADADVIPDPNARRPLPDA